MSHSSAWLDYARLRRIYEVEPATMLQNLFPLCHDLLLTEVPLPARTETFHDEWSGIEQQFKAPRGRGWTGQEQMRRLRERIAAYNTSLRAFLPEWQTAANELLADFTDLTALSLSLERTAEIGWSNNWWVLIQPRIQLSLTYRDHTPANPTAFLNEARQTACAISLWLAALLRTRPHTLAPGETYPRILILDDILLSVDLDHRRPLIQVIKTHFSSCAGDLADT